MNEIDILIKQIENKNDKILKKFLLDFKNVNFKALEEELEDDIKSIFKYYLENIEEKVPNFINAVIDFYDDELKINKFCVIDEKEEIIHEIELKSIVNIWNMFVETKKNNLNDDDYLLYGLILNKIIEIGKIAGEKALKSKEFEKFKEIIEPYEYFGGIQKSFMIEFGDIEDDISGVIFSWEESLSTESEDYKEFMYLIVEGEEFYNSGDFESAVKCFNEAKKIYEEKLVKINNDEYKELYAACLMNLGNYYSFELGDSLKAIENYEKCINVSEELENKNVIKDEIMLPSVYINLGSEYVFNKNYEKGGYYLIKGGNKLKENNYQDEEVLNLLLYSLIKQGELYFILGDYAKSIERYNEAISINNGKDFETEAELLFRIGKNYMFLNNNDKMRNYLLKAKELFEKEKKINEESYKEIINILNQNKN